MNTTTNAALPKTDLRVVDQILSALKSGQTFCLSGHQNPDPDVIGSQLALASLIRRLGSGKKIDIQNHGAVPRSLSFLPGIEAVKNVTKADGSYDVVVVFECSGADRMGDIVNLETQAKTVINIDHHLHNPNFGHINFVEPATSSTAEMIFKIFERSDVPLGKDEAVCLYAGLVVDTGWFRYGNTSLQTHDIAGKLLAAGVQPASVHEHLNWTRSVAAVKIMGWVLSNMKLILDNRIAVMTVPEQILGGTGGQTDDLEDLVNQGLQMESVCASVLLKEKTDPPLVKVSFRSKSAYDINQVARKFGGGGHKNASGCTIPGSLAQAEEAVLKELTRIF